MNESIKLLQAFYESFEQSIKNGYIEESSLKTLESNKVKILMPFLQAQAQNSKYIKLYVTKIWNYCRMLNYVRNIKDTDNNYALLRIKEFICDLFFTLFANFSNDITLQDTFNLLQLVTEVGRSWISINNSLPNQLDGWVKKIDSIMKFLIVKISEVETLVNIDQKYYQNLINYLNFYIETFLINNTNAIESLFEEITKILFLIKNVQFISSENETKNLLIHLIEVIQKEEIDKRLLILDAFNELKYKKNLPLELIADVYKYYLNSLIDNHQTEKANEIIKDVLTIIQPNTREEIDYFIIHLYLLLKLNESKEKISEMIEVLFEHKELTIEDIESMMIKLSSYQSCNKLFIQLFCKKLFEMKNLKFCNTKIVFSYENIKKYPVFPIVFLYQFFKEIIMTHDEIDIGNILSPVLFDFIKNTAESLLDNFISNSYSEEYSCFIPSIFENVITLFLKYDINNESFGNYFLIEIIRRGKSSPLTFWKHFSQMSLDIYIEKKDYPKLKAIIQELEEQKEINSQLYYSKIILCISEGIKWNTVNNIQHICLEMNTCKDFDIALYIKILSFIYENNICDINLFSILVMNFTTEYCQLLKEKDPNELLKSLNGYALIDCLYEVIYYSTKSADFTKQIVSFVEVFDIIGSVIETMKFNTKIEANQITSSFSLVIDLVKLIIDLKNTKYDNKTSSFTYPEFILVSLSKMLNFVFNNFHLVLLEFTMIGPTTQESLSPIISLFELYQTLKIFYVSYEYTNNTFVNDTGKLKEKYNQYQSNLMNSLKLFLEVIQDSTLKQTIDTQINTMINGSKTIEQILQIQIMLKSEEQKSLSNYILKLLSENVSNKKLIFIINSLLYQNGFRDLSNAFLSELLNKILVVNNIELFNKVYSLDEILAIFKDYVNSIDDKESFDKKNIALKEYQVFLCKLYGKVDDSLLCENIEWVYYQIYQQFEKYSNMTRIAIPKNNSSLDENVSLLKEIFTELNTLHIRNKPIVTMTLVDLIMNKMT